MAHLPADRLAFPAEPEPESQALRETYLPRGELATTRSNAIPSTLDEEIAELTGVPASQWHEESEAICRAIFEHSKTGGPSLGGPGGIPGGELARERVGPLEGPVTVWRQLTYAFAPSEEEAQALAVNTRGLVFRLVRGMREEELLTALDAGDPRQLAELEARLVDLCRAHRLMLAIATSWRREGPTWDRLASIDGTATAARRVLDTYPRWFLAPPWSPAARLRLIDVLPGQGVRPGLKPHVEAVVDRLSVVLVSWELRRTGMRAGRSWLWVHRTLAVAKGNPRAAKLESPVVLGPRASISS